VSPSFIPPEPYVSPIEREKAEALRKQNEHLAKIAALLGAQKATPPAETPKPQTTPKRKPKTRAKPEPEPKKPLKAVDPDEPKELLQWVRDTLETRGWPRDKKWLPKALLAVWVDDEGRPLPMKKGTSIPVKESSFRSRLGRWLKKLKP
jgi:hypothetical protein